MQLVVFGMPGAGKGTQSRILSEKQGIPHLSTGEMLRTATTEGTENGKIAAKLMNSGQLVPDDTIIEIVKERLSQAECSEGYILDGFPRTLFQATALDSHLKTKGESITHVLYLNTDAEKIVSRLVDRRICSQCGKEYHLKYSKPMEIGVCDLDGFKLIQRTDDKEELIKERLKIYADQTKPILEFYEDLGLLLTINAVGTIKEIEQKIKKLI